MGIETREMTVGENMVGKSFNPSGDIRVDRLKQVFADAIDILVGGESVDHPYTTHAINLIVDAQMASVKCLFLKQVK